MSDTVYQDEVRGRIVAWRAEKPGARAYLMGLAGAPVTWMTQSMIPASAVQAALTGLDWVARRTLGRRLGEDGEDLRACDKAAERVIRAHAVAAAMEGGAAGVFGLLTLPADLPALIGLSLRTVRQVGVEYGYSSDTAAESRFVFAVLAATGANNEAEKLAALAPGDGAAPGQSIGLEASIIGVRTLARQLAVNLAQRRSFAVVPLIGGVVGATANGWFVRDVGLAAQRLYQERWLRDHGTAETSSTERVSKMNVVTRAGGNALKQLEAFGQSPWLDFIQRSFTANGLQELIDRDGLKGITSNPAIFEKAMGSSGDYDAGFRLLADGGDHDALDIYEALAIEDIQQAADMMRPVYDATGKVDGYVSLEVSPYLALKTDATVAEARRLWKAVGRENLMVKVPGTDNGVAAIRTLISEGININVTLLFAQSAYEAVAEAFVAGLEARAAKGESIAGLSSVASFFVSRIDSAIDKKIDERLAQEPGLMALRGKVAIANAKLAYQHYLGLVAGPRWAVLAEKGALPQRLLWASTGVKDKAYSDVMYVEQLIGRDTVDTIPPATMDAFRDHGRVVETLTQDLVGAQDVMARAETAGLDMRGVTETLVADGVKLFADAADKLLGVVADRRVAMLGDRIAKLELAPGPVADAVKARRTDWRASGKLRDLWAGDPKVWTGADEAKWLGWLRIVDDRMADLPALLAFQDDVESAGFSHVLLLGMGGSSLGPEVLAKTFGKQPGYPELLVLDSTDPGQIAHVAARVDLARTLCIVSSKSGSTLEPNILKAFFFDKMKAAVGDKAGQHFVAVTDPGSKLEAVAKADGFRHVFLGDPTIGGRYSVLSNFGIVPLAAMGVDVRAFLEATALMVRSCAAGTPPDANPGVQLGLLLGEAARAGRDKVTIVAGPGLSDVGAWLEQLLAESTGRQGHGIVPVDEEPLGTPAVYGSDRVFASLVLAADERAGQAADERAGQAAALKALEAAGHPVVRLMLASPMQVGQAFYLLEFATAVAGSVIGIDPFDQPDVEASKIETRKLTDAYARDGSLPVETPFLTEDGVSLFTDEANRAALGSGGLDAVIAAHLKRAHAGDYVALLAYIERDAKHIEALAALRLKIRDRLHVATCVGFGPRFLHSTGQTYKGGPNSGVVLQITAADAADLAVPGEKYSFGTVKAAQARGDFDVLVERKRRALRVHLDDVEAGLARLAKAVDAALV